VKNSLVVGITGGIGCGKSTVTELFFKLGVKVVDADVIAREVVQPDTEALAAIAVKFGDQILLANGRLDRAKLRAIIFDNSADKLWLESLLHPIIRSRISSRLRTPETIANCSANPHYALLSSPLLLETDQHTMTDCIIVIDIDPEIQIHRSMLRDNNSREQIERIIRSQIPRAERREKADIIIDNSGTIAQLTTQINQIHQQLIATAATFSVRSHR